MAKNHSSQIALGTWIQIMAMFLDGHAPSTISKSTGVAPGTISKRAMKEGWVEKREQHLAAISTAISTPIQPPKLSIQVQSVDWLDGVLIECKRLFAALTALDPPDTIPRMIQHAEALSKLDAVARRSLRMDVELPNGGVNLRVFDNGPVRIKQEVLDVDEVMAEPTKL